MARNTRLSAMSLLAGLWVVGPHAAIAQTTEPTAAASGIESIIVTARRREENLERVPTAITALGASQLSERNIKYLGEVDRKSARLSVLWQPNDALENLLLAQYDDVGGSSTAVRLRTVNRLGTANGGFPLNTTADFLFSPLADVAFGAGTWAAYVAAHPQVNPNGIAAYMDQDAPRLGFLETNEVSDVFHDEQSYYLINTTSYALS